MKRTLNINIGNSIIHIEEDAYELLTSYLNEIKAHFARNADDFEIVTDIENRIAEMFLEILTIQQKQVINIDDVRVIMAQMGSVHDFETGEEAAEPIDSSYSTGVKKLYRDTDQGMVAGVCAGLAHYLNVEARWVRLFALITIFFGGAGILAYLVMWIMVPRAATRSEKMYMKGEAVNLQGFIRSFQEEMESNQLIKRSGGFLSEMVDWLGKFLGGAGSALFKIFAAIIIFIASGMLLSLVAALAAFLGIFDANTNEVFPLSMVDPSYLSPLLIAIFLALAIPLLALVLFGVRVAFNGRPMNRSVSFGLLIIWLLGVATSIFYIAKVTSEFKEEAEFTQIMPLKPYPVYTLELNNSRFFSKEDSIRYKINAEGYKGKIILDDREGPFNNRNNVRIDIVKSLDSVVSVSQNYSAHGKTFELALRNAQNIKYDFQQQDSLLHFSSSLHLDKNVNWRDQEVRLTVKVPVGTKLILSEKLDRYLNQYGSWACNEEGERNRDYIEWVMTEEGLKCQYELNQGTHQHDQ
ncbi:PspC domain-containing protein [Pedobacter immunditicola]|uniref:PspC domain-containing protein n=1 Tax=Pedobacter immunditicola TaxID=3133440 RepID=UPI0030A7EA70